MRIEIVIVLAVLTVFGAGLTGTARGAETPAGAGGTGAGELETLHGPLGDDPIEGSELTPAVVAAAERGLDYLAKVQNSDGSYGRSGGYVSHAGITALAGIAFLSQGSQPERGKYGKNVALALDFIVKHTGRSGLIIGESVDHGPMYGQGFATLFLAEAYGTSPRPEVRDKLSRAVDLIVRTQNDQGGWRYQPVKLDADLSVTICEIMALRAARNAGIKVPKATIDRALKYVKDSQNPDGGFSYTLESHLSGFPRSAAGVCSLYNCGIYSGPELDRGLRYVFKTLPGGRGDMASQGYYFYGNYYATQAMFIAGGDYWKKWWPAISSDLVKKQGKDGSWSGEAGQEFATAMGCIILQIPNRYLPILQR
jgi:hypothetical protein